MTSRTRLPLPVALISMSLLAGAQDVSKPEMPVTTQWVLDAAGVTQRNAVKSVLLMVCPVTQKKGTAFSLTSGLIVTNEHVVHGCQANELVGSLPSGQGVQFKTMVVDADRDLAVLRPTKALPDGLELGSDATLKIGNTVSTWGFPLIYNGPAPLLSVGYVAGFNAVKVGPRTVKHIVVNGAFNPGNSEGPVFLSQDNHVIGVVVWKQRIMSQLVPTVIDSFMHPNVSMSSTLVQRLPDGTSRPVSQQEAIGLVLEEFYDTVQVMIGEAISVSELKALIATMPPEPPAQK
jgi:S1-C subfamily serine protease